MRAFIDDQADGTQIGIVAFTGYAEIVVPPTNDKEALNSAIDNFTTALGTAIGSAILKSIDAIAEINENLAYSGVNLGADQPDESPSLLSELDVEDVGYQPDIVVVLTDGANSNGMSPIDAAQQAADRRVRVYTIGFGTQNPGDIVCTREQLGSDVFGRGGGFGGGGFGGGGGGGFRRYLLLDEPTLRGVAEMTGGQFFLAEDAEQLLNVFLNLPNNVVMQTENIEISVLFSTLGALLATVAVGLSLLWNRFP